VFESVFLDDASSRLRSAAVPPLASFLLTLGYLTLYPILGHVPAALFWSVVLILAVGAVVGATRIVRILRAERIRGRALGWLTGAAGLTLICAYLALNLTFPWL
jgi:hypothetical protein